MLSEASGSQDGLGIIQHILSNLHHSQSGSDYVICNYAKRRAEATDGRTALARSPCRIASGARSTLAIRAEGAREPSRPGQD